jgi:hypothetical protein
LKEVVDKRWNCGIVSMFFELQGVAVVAMLAHNETVASSILAPATNFGMMMKGEFVAKNPGRESVTGRSYGLIDNITSF